MFFQKANDLRPMPPGVAELDGETEIARQLHQKIAQSGPAVFRREGRRQLNENDLQLGRERLDCTKEGI